MICKNFAGKLPKARIEVWNQCLGEKSKLEFAQADDSEIFFGTLRM